MFALLEIALSNAVVASLLALGAIAVGRMGRRPALTHSLWLLVLLKLITPPVIPIPIVNLSTDRNRAAAAARRAADPEQTRDRSLTLLSGRVGEMQPPDRIPAMAGQPRVVDGPFVQASPTFAMSSSRELAAGLEPVESSAAGADAAAAWATAFLSLRAILVPLLALGWIGGSVLVATLAVVRVVRFHRLLKHGVPAPSWLRDEVQRLGGRVGLKRSPAMLLVPGTIPPLVWPFGRRPQLIFPEKLLERMGPQERETTLLHELSHLRRHDHWVRFLELAASCCYWWHPVVWRARREIQRSEEACCDAWVVRHSFSGGRPYANALLAMVDFLADSRAVMPPMASGFGRVESLRQRLTMIMQGTTPPRLSGMGRLAVISVAVCALPLWPMVGQEPTTEPETSVPIEKAMDEGSGFNVSTAWSDARETQPGPETTATVSTPTFPEPTEFETVARAFRLDVQGIRSVAFSGDGRLLAVAHGGFRTEGAVRIWDIDQKKEIALWEEPKGICSVHVSPDGSLVASQSLSDKLVRVRSVESGEELLQIDVGDRSARVRFSPDGRTLATASTEGELKLWNVDDGKELKSLASLSFNLQCVAFSRDGTRIVAGGGPHREDNFGWAGVWEIASGNLIAEMKDMPDAVLGIAISPNGKLVATAGRDKVARLWEAETGNLVSTLAGHRSALEWIDFSPDGKMLASGSYDHTAKLWSVDSGQEVAILSDHDGTVATTRFSPDGRTLVTAGSEGVVRLWDVATRRPIDVLYAGLSEGDVPRPVLAVAYSPNQKLVASVHADNTVRLRDPSTGRMVHLLEGHDDLVSSVAFSPDGRILATAGDDKKVKLWDVRQGRELKTLVGHTGAVLSVAFSPDGKGLASGGSDNTIRLWDVVSGDQRAKLDGHSAAVRGIAYCVDGKRLASGGDDGTARIWDTGTLEELATLTGHAGTIQAVAFSPDGKTLASAGEDKSVRLWDVASGELRSTLAGHAEMVRCLAFSPRGKTLASGGGDNLIKLWDPDSGSQRATLRGHGDAVTSLAFTPDTSALVSGSQDKTIRYWKSRWPRIAPLATLRVTDDGARCRFGIFSPDGMRMITAGDDKVIRVWDLRTGRLLRSDAYHGGTPICGSLSPDGKLLATGTYGKTIHLWDVAAGRRVGELATGEEKSLTVDFSPDGKRLAVSSGSKTVSVWNVRARRKLWGSLRQSLPVTGVVFSPDGKTLATTSGNWKMPHQPGEAKLWDAQSGKELAIFSTDARKLTRACFGRNGGLLVTGSADATLRIFDVQSRRLNSTIRVSAFGPVQSLALLPDGKSVLAGHYGGGVSLSDIDSGRILAEYVGATDKIFVTETSCSPDGSLIASVGADGAVRLWPTTRSTSPGAATSAQRARGWVIEKLSLKDKPRPSAAPTDVEKDEAVSDPIRPREA